MNEAVSTITILLADDDAVFRKALSGALERRGHTLLVADGGERALALLANEKPDVALLDLKMPGMDGLELMQELKRRSPNLPVVILTGHGTIPSAIEAIQAGAHQYQVKPCDVEEVENLLFSAIRDSRLSSPATERRVEPPTSLGGIIGTSPAIRQLVARIEKARDSWSPVLIQGESGSGKELVARALHEGSERDGTPFVTVGCAGLKPELVEERLFGHVEGAFPGADEDSPGAFADADGGTLFFDEIANLNLDVQATLLRVVESGVYRPLGASREASVRFRLVASANCDLHEAVAQGRFREDLLYRLEVIHLVVPPLRDRTEDIPLLVDHWLQTSDVARGKSISMAPAALNLLRTHRWPGNVRELFHVLERAVVESTGGTIGAPEIEAVLRPHFRPGAPRQKEPVTLEESEKQHIVRMLERESGNVSRVSEILGIDRRTLQRKMKRYGLR